MMAIKKNDWGKCLSLPVVSLFTNLRQNQAFVNSDTTLTRIDLKINISQPTCRHAPKHWSFLEKTLTQIVLTLHIPWWLSQIENFWYCHYHWVCKPWLKYANLPCLFLLWNLCFHCCWGLNFSDHQVVIYYCCHFQISGKWKLYFHFTINGLLSCNNSVYMSVWRLINWTT